MRFLLSLLLLFIPAIQVQDDQQPQETVAIRVGTLVFPHKGKTFVFIPVSPIMECEKVTADEYDCGRVVFEAGFLVGEGGAEDDTDTKKASYVQPRSGR